MLPFTQKMLLDWAGPVAFRDGLSLYERGAVQESIWEDPFLKGTLSLGNRALRTSARVLPDMSCESHCPCRDNRERGIICAHVIAVGLALVRRYANADQLRTMEQEKRRTQHMQLITQAIKARQDMPAPARPATARLRLKLGRDWPQGLKQSRVPVYCGIECEGRTFSPAQAPRDADGDLGLSTDETNILFVLEDIAQGPIQEKLELGPMDFLNLLDLLEGCGLEEEGRTEPLIVNGARMSSTLFMDLDRENGELLLFVRTELPFLRPGEFPLYILGSRSTGWAYGAGNFWPLARVIPPPFRAVYDGTVSIPRDAVPRFLKSEISRLRQLMPVESDITEDLFTIEPERPAYRLVLRGSPASISATLYARYGDIDLPAGKIDPRGHFSHPDPSDLMRYTIRDLDHEKKALEKLARHGFQGDTGDRLSSMVGTRLVRNFLGRSSTALRRMGWRIEWEGSIRAFMESTRFVTPVVRVASGPDNAWFDVAFEYDDGQGGSLNPAEIQQALLKDEFFIEKNGRTILLDGAAIQAMHDVFSDCASGEGRSPGSFRLNGLYAPYVKASLDALDGVDIEADPVWMSGAERLASRQALEGTPEVAIPAHMQSILRGYQKEGLRWLRFLETCSFGGILADEMGLGKTVQALVWLQMERAHPSARGKPALIVCPTSLVENWEDEAKKFTASLRVITLSGADRHEKWARMADADVVVTSYALMRRDIEQYVTREFSVVLLDEAQHIKNRSTQNALAAKRLRAYHRLVLTGTPVENSVSDLWSIMDFLMPDYLGTHERFRQRYELPIATGGEEGEAAQNRLRRKLQPFLMRRLKKDVAKDLPPKIERVAYCSMTIDQQRVYRELVLASRRQIEEIVVRQGFSRSRLEILTILLRLRQACCHLDLLKVPDLRSEQPSGKMDLFFELMEEALDAGHRVLVFSQFVQMLTILRQDFESRGWKYCYLDGATKERMDVVRTFNADHTVPAFLISLKAGGTGLNLTGADMVIHFDPWWNPAVENQATDRAYRIGQKRTVYAVKLITRDSIEERVMNMQKRKKAVIDATVEKSDEQIINDLSYEEIQELLTL